MGQTTPNIGIFIPAAGETNFDASFAAGMVNVDQHDHSGAPNKGVPINAPGIGAGSVTRSKLNANVVLAGGGLAVDPGSPNALKADGVLNSIYNLAGNGIIVKTGAGTSTTRTIVGTPTQINVANGDGVAGNPTVSLQASPAFLVYLANSIVGVTGNSTKYIVAFDTEQYDSTNPGHQFDIATSTFTCVEDGVYQFNASVIFLNLTAAMTKGNLILLSTAVPVNNECVLCRNNPWVISDGPAPHYATYSGSVLLNMVVGDTAQIQLQVIGGAGDTVDLLGASNFTCFFSGTKVK